MRFLIDLLSIFAVPHITIQKDGHGGKGRAGVIGGGNRRMKLIIDISEDAYMRHKRRVNTDMCTELDIAVVNGTPLDDVRAEIKQLRSHSARFRTSSGRVVYFDSQDILDILDNIGKESEEV